MRRSTWAAVTAVLILSVLPARASSGGGNWIETDPEFIGIGDTVTARATFSASREAVEERGSYYAYLAPQPSKYVLPDPRDPNTILLGNVEVLWPEDHEWRGMLRHNPRAEITFTAPEVEGPYILVFCDLACEQPLGDVDITYVALATTGEEARLENRLASARAHARYLESRLQEHRDEVASMDAYFERAGERARVAEREAHRLKGETVDLRESLAALSGARSRERWIVGLGLALLIGSVTSMKVRALRRRRRVTSAVSRILRDSPVDASREEWRLIDS
jgi:hypothetical protein